MIFLSIFELMMIISFGCSWPLSILKSYRACSTKGKSLAFLIIVWFGYIAGILHKIFFSFDLILVAYVINLLMVSIDIGLFFRNRRIERQTTAA